MKLPAICTMKAQMTQERVLRAQVRESGFENVRVLGRSSVSLGNGNSGLRSLGEESAVLFESREKESESLSEGSEKTTGPSRCEVKLGVGTPRNGSSESGVLLRIPADVRGETGEPKGESDPFLEPLVKQHREGVLHRAQLVAEALKTREAVWKIFEEMWAEVSKSQAERAVLILQTAKEVSEIVRACHLSRLESSQESYKAFLETFLECSRK